jgi:peptidoglycan/LPS O-acetylase OafA/YrhL
LEQIIMFKRFSLPAASLLGAAALAGIAMASRPVAGPLTEIDIGLIAWTLVLSIFGIQALVSLVVEGPEPRPGTRPPHSPLSLSVLIAVGCLLLVGLAAALGGAILSGQTVAFVGACAGAGCLVLALVLGAYKQAFIGEEVRVETRQDGIPW